MKALVLLPGMDGSGTLFNGFAGAMRRHAPAIELIVVSYPARQALGYAELLEHARMQLPRHGSYALLGESFSGPLAIRLAASRPPGLCGLILCGTFIRNPARLLAPLSRLPAGLLAGLLSLLPRRPPALFLRHFLMDARSSPLLAPAVLRALRPLGRGVLAARLAAVLRGDASTELANLRLPILYLRASRDRLIDHAVAEQMHALQPAMRIADFDAPHLLLQTRPDESARAVQSFLGELAGAPA